MINKSEKRMVEIEIEGVSTRRVLKQAGEVLNRELDALYADRRDNEMTIATQNSIIALMDSEKSDWLSEKRSLEGDVVRAESRQRQEQKITDMTIQIAIYGWIVAFVAIGYGVWVG